MIIYVPTPITSAEQAEALPAGVVAISDEDWPVVKLNEGVWARGGETLSSTVLALEGYWTALVPVAAEEYHSEPMGTRHHLDPVTGPKPMTAWVTET